MMYVVCWLTVTSNCNMLKLSCSYNIDLVIFVQIYGVSTKGTLISEFEDALLKQERGHMSSLALRQSKENRFQSLIQSRLTELEGCFLFLRTIGYLILLSWVVLMNHCFFGFADDFHFNKLMIGRAKFGENLSKRSIMYITYYLNITVLISKW